MAVIPSVIARWSHETAGVTTDVSLLRERDQVSFSATSGPEVRTGPVELSGHDPRNVSSLVRSFRNVIGENLERDISPSSFFPVFSWRNPITRKANGEFVEEREVTQVGLFGRVDRAASWGVSYGPGRSERFDVEANRELAESCLREAPACLAAAGADGMNEYRRRLDAHADDFRVVMEKDAHDVIRAISLRNLFFPSQLDPKIPIDERNWALTVVSTAPHACGLPSVGFSRDCGHSMIAYEGLRDNRPFLECVHITTTPPHVADPQDARRPSNQARVETRGLPGGTAAGPTWLRPRKAVEDMLLPIKKDEREPRWVPFEQYRDGYRVGTYVLGGVGIAVMARGAFLSRNTRSLRHLAQSAVLLATSQVANYLLRRDLRPAANSLNCVRWVEGNIPAAGINIGFSCPSVLTPNGFVELLKANQEKVTFTEPAIRRSS